MDRRRTADALPVQREVAGTLCRTGGPLQHRKRSLGSILASVRGGAIGVIEASVEQREAVVTVRQATDTASPARPEMA